MNNTGYDVITMRGQPTEVRFFLDAQDWTELEKSPEWKVLAKRLEQLQEDRPPEAAPAVPDERELQIDALHAAPLVDGTLRGLGANRLIVDYTLEKVIVEYAPGKYKEAEEYDLDTTVLSGMPAGYYSRQRSG